MAGHHVASRTCDGKSLLSRCSIGVDRAEHSPQKLAVTAYDEKMAATY